MLSAQGQMEILAAAQHFILITTHQHALSPSKYNIIHV